MNMDRFREPTRPDKSELLEEQERLLEEREVLQVKIGEIDDRLEDVETELFAVPGA